MSNEEQAMIESAESVSLPQCSEQENTMILVAQTRLENNEGADSYNSEPSNSNEKQPGNAGDEERKGSDGDRQLF